MLDAYGTLSAGKLRGLQLRWMNAIPVSPKLVGADVNADDLPIRLGSTNQCRRRFATLDAHRVRWSRRTALGCGDRAHATRIVRRLHRNRRRARA